MVLLRWARRAVLAGVLLVVLLVAVTAFRVWQVARQNQSPRSDVILVLGAAQFDGRPSDTLRARLDHAAGLFRQGVAAQVLTVGGSQLGDRFTEAEAGQRYLLERGLPTDRVLIVPEGHDTLASLQAARTQLAQHRWHSVVLVTDPWHSLRARRMARDLGVAASTSPTRTGPSVRSRATELRYIARETLAYLYYRLFDRSSESGPRGV